MRELISIVEARSKKAPSIDPVAQAQAVYDRALMIAKTVAHDLMIRQWNQEWVTALRHGVAAARQKHNNNEADEAKFDDDYQVRPFALDVEEITPAWWQKVVEPSAREMLEAAKNEYERYQDWKPDVESSDQMSLHQAEVELATTIVYRSNDSLAGLNTLLGAFDTFHASILHLSDIDYTNLATRETEDFAAKIMPSILTICRMHGAKSG